MTSTAPLTGPSGPGVEGGLRELVREFERRSLAARADEVLAERSARTQRTRARDIAEEAELILALATKRSAAGDPPPEHPGALRSGWRQQAVAADVSEFFPDELATVLNVGRTTAAIKLRRALTWRDRLPRTFALLASGELDERRASALADELAAAPADVAGRVEDALLGAARELSVTTLGDRAAALVLQFDPVAAEERREQAAKAADVHLYPSPTDGHAVIAVDLPADEAAEAKAVIDALAQMLKADGDPRPIGVLRTHVASLLWRVPGGHGLPQICVNVTVTADLAALENASDRTGEVNGLVITAAHLRELLTRIGALGLTAPEGGSLSFAVTGPDGELLATVTAAELDRPARRGCPEHTDTDDGTACWCAVLGAPPATTAYRPTAKQRAFVTTRDRRCRFPNCGQRVGWADMDHVIAHRPPCRVPPRACEWWGARGSFDFARGWRFRMEPDGTLHVTTPTGIARTTRPPGLRRRPPEAERPPEGERPPEPPDDPPPF